MAPRSSIGYDGSHAPAHVFGSVRSAYRAKESGRGDRSGSVDAETLLKGLAHPVRGDVRVAVRPEGHVIIGTFAAELEVAPEFRVNGDVRK